MRRHKRFEAPLAIGSIVLTFSLVDTRWSDAACLALAFLAYLVCALLFAAIEMYGVPFARHLIGLVDDRRRDRELGRSMEQEATAHLQMRAYQLATATGSILTFTPKHGRHAHNGPSAA